MNTTVEPVTEPIIPVHPVTEPAEPEPVTEPDPKPVPRITISTKGQGNFEVEPGDWAYTDIGIFAEGYWNHERQATGGVAAVQRDVEFPFESIAYIEYHGLGGE